MKTLLNDFLNFDKPLNQKLSVILILNVISTVLFNKFKFMRFINNLVFFGLVIHGVIIAYNILKQKDCIKNFRFK